MTQNTYPHIDNPELNDQPGQAKNKIVLVVKMNSYEAFVLKEPIKLIYYKFGTDTIIGTDGIFYTFYMKDWAGWSKDAFGGRKFTLTMHDGEEVLCEGQWWDAVSPTAKMLMEGIDFVHTAANSLQRLQECYVYCGYQTDSLKLEELRATYAGPVLEYYEGEFVIKSWKKKHGKLIGMLRGFQNTLCVIDEHHDLYEVKTIAGKLYFTFRQNISPDDWYNQYFTEGRKDFSGHEPRTKPVYHICKFCKSDDATMHYMDNEYYCHRCSKEFDRQEAQSNYSHY